MAKNKIKFNKYNSKSNYDRAKNNGEVDNATFSVVRTPDCNANENNNNTGDVKDLYINDTKLTDVYNSRKANGSKTSVSVGGLPAGTDISTLTRMSLGEVLDKILFKTTTPTIKTKPSMSISYSPVDYLVGTTFPEITNSNISVNCGMYQLEKDGSYVDCGVVSDGFDSIEEIVYTPSDRVTVAGTNKITVKVRIKSGPTPTDSDGNPYTSTTPQIPYQGGVFNKSVTIHPYYNWFATGKEVEKETSPQIDITKKYPLTTLKFVENMGISVVKNVMLDMGAGDAEHPQTIKVPGTISDTKVSVNGNWVDYSLSSLYGTPTTETINGRTYFVYTVKSEVYTDGAVGGSRLKFTVTP